MRHKVEQLERRLLLGQGWQETDLVFDRGDGAPTHPDSVSKMFQELARDAGLPVIRLHDARRTAATIMLAAGINPKVVSERLGHATIAVTLDTYSHVPQSSVGSGRPHRGADLWVANG
jgi:integrase